MSIDLSAFKKALLSLEKALECPPKNDLERDGAIQRFEYTFELAWKMAKRVLQEQGIVALSPKNIIRELGQQGWIDDVELWFAFLEARNTSSHTYEQKVAEKVFAAAKAFCREGQRLLHTLQSKV